MILDSIFSIVDLADLTKDIIKQNQEERQTAQSEKKELLSKLETASGEDMFKLMNMISLANMDEFVAEARLHAQQSFKICMWSAAMGFLIILISIGFGIYFQLAGDSELTAAYLGSAVGLITEAISAIFFTLYTRTTNQVNRLYDRLQSSQSSYAALLSTSLLGDQATKNEQIVALSKEMIGRSKELDKIV